MSYMGRSVLRRASADYPVGSPSLGYFDPMTAMAGVQTLGVAAGASASGDATSSAKHAENVRINNLQPFRETGTAALSEFQSGIGQQPVYADIVAGMESDPGYKFALSQGTKAVEGSAAARGMLRSGRTLKDLATYAQELAASRSGDAYTRELNAYNNKQNQLMNLVQLGANSAGAQTQLPALALQQGQSRADTAINAANIGTNYLSNLAMAKMLQSGSAVSPEVTTMGPNGPITNSATVSWN